MFMVVNEINTLKRKILQESCRNTLKIQMPLLLLGGTASLNLFTNTPYTNFFVVVVKDTEQLTQVRAKNSRISNVIFMILNSNNANLSDLCVSKYLSTKDKKF